MDLIFLTLRLLWVTEVWPCQAQSPKNVWSEPRLLLFPRIKIKQGAGTETESVSIERRRRKKEAGTRKTQSDKTTREGGTFGRDKVFSTQPSPLSSACICSFLAQRNGILFAIRYYPRGSEYLNKNRRIDTVPEVRTIILKAIFL